MHLRRLTFSVSIAVLLAGVHGLAGQSLTPAVTTIAVAPACPALGATASWTASATGGTAPIEYRFWLRNDTAGTWALLADYSTAVAAAWTPTVPGRYFTQVWV